MRDESNNNSSMLKQQSQPSSAAAVGDHLRISVCCNQGGRKYMEDRVSVHCEFSPDGKVDYIFMGIFDGHGGSDASTFAQENLLQTITKQPGFNSFEDSEVLEAIRVGFLETHDAMRKVVDTWPRTASGFTSTSGTTASVAFIRRGKLYIGHVGDSGIILGSQKQTGEMVGSSLTVEHKPDAPEEKKRIEDFGGEVMNKSGVMRVVWVRPLRGHQGPVRRSTPKEKIPFLAVARALGDLWSYNSDMNAFVVSPEPDVSVVTLDNTHRCLIFGSDGVWNVLRPQHAVDIVNSHEWKEDEFNYIVNKNEGYETNHARWLGRHALMRWGSLRADNISVITVIFGNRGVVDSPYAKRVEPGNLSIENYLTSEPTSVVKIAPEKITVVPSKPVELVYYGVSEMAAPMDRQPNGCVNGARNGRVGNKADYCRIPGYTDHEKGPVFGGGTLITSSSQTTVVQSSLLNRSSASGPAATTPPSYRQYPPSNQTTGASSQAANSYRKENGTTSTLIQASMTKFIFSKPVATIKPVLISTEGANEESSEVEDELEKKRDESNMTMDVDQENDGNGSKMDIDDSNHDLSNGFIKPAALSLSPCKIHAIIACCSCTLIRAPLMQRSTGTPTPTTPKEKATTPKSATSPLHHETPIFEETLTTTPMRGKLRQQLTSPRTPPTSTPSSSAKSRRSLKHLRSCPAKSSLTGTPHSYNTRRSIRMTRAGTKLSPQKSFLKL